MTSNSVAYVRDKGHLQQLLSDGREFFGGRYHLHEYHRDIFTPFQARDEDRDRQPTERQQEDFLETLFTTMVVNNAQQPYCSDRSESSMLISTTIPMCNGVFCAKRRALEQEVRQWRANKTADNDEDEESVHDESEPKKMKWSEDQQYSSRDEVLFDIHGCVSIASLSFFFFQEYLPFTILKT